MKMNWETAIDIYTLLCAKLLSFILFLLVMVNVFEKQNERFQNNVCCFVTGHNYLLL